MYVYLNKILFKWQCGFRQGYSAQHCLLIITEKLDQCLDKEGISGALLTDLFDCLLHDLLIAKLAAYSFDYDCLCLPKLHSATSALTRVEFLFRLPLGIGMLFRVGTPYSSVRLCITSRGCEGET